MARILVGCMCATSWYDLNLAFDIAVGTLTFKILPGQFLVTVRCNKLILCRDIGWGCRCAIPLCNIKLYFVLAIVTLTFKILSWIYLANSQV